jgi:hypothetical protein
MSRESCWVQNENWGRHPDAESQVPERDGFGSRRQALRPFVAGVADVAPHRNGDHLPFKRAIGVAGRGPRLSDGTAQGRGSPSLSIAPEQPQMTTAAVVALVALALLEPIHHQSSAPDCTSGGLVCARYSFRSAKAHSPLRCIKLYDASVGADRDPEGTSTRWTLASTTSPHRRGRTSLW